MTSVSLGDVAETVMGQAPPGKACNKEGKGTAFVKAGEFDVRFPIVREWTTEPLKFARLGDVLVCVVGATSGKVNQAIDCAIGRSVAAVRPRNGKLDSGYLYHYLSDKTQALRTRSQGLAQGVITREMLHDLEIPLPPLDEQRRIAAILDQADELRRLRRRAIDRLNQLGQSIFYDMFVAGNSEEWAITKIEDVVVNARTGPFGSQLLHTEFVDEGIPVLGIDNVVSNRFAWGKPRHITLKKYHELKRYTVFPGDVLITIMGTCGRCAVAPDDIPTSINTKHICCLTPKADLVKSGFLRAVFLMHPWVLRQLGVEAKGAVMPGLNMGIIKSLEFPLPPLKLQDEFVGRMNLAESACAKLEAGAESFETLFSSLQHRAFRGEL